MRKYIDADWIVRRLKTWQRSLAQTYGKNDEYVICLSEVLMIVDDAPTADVVERKVGKWINDKGLYKCSACNELWTVGWACCIPIKQMYKEVRYCPHCGAKMEGEKDA